MLAVVIKTQQPRNKSWNDDDRCLGRIRRSLIAKARKGQDVLGFVSSRAKRHILVRVAE